MKVYEITEEMFRNELLKPICEDILEMNTQYLDTKSMYRNVNKLLGEIEQSEDPMCDLMHILCIGMECTLDNKTYNKGYYKVGKWLDEQ